MKNLSLKTQPAVAYQKMNKATKILIFLLIITGPSLFSQDYRSFSLHKANIVEKTTFRLGPIRMYPLIKFREIGYDSNIFRETQAQEPTKDFTMTFSPEIQFNMLIGNNFVLSFVENPEYVFYFDQTDLRAFSNSYFIESRLRMFYGLVLSARYTSSDRRYRPWGEFVEKVNEQQQGYSASFFYEGFDNTILGVSANYQSIFYSDITNPDQMSSLGLRLNRDVYHVSAEMHYEFFSEISFFIRTIYSDYTFKFPETRFKDSLSLQTSFGLNFPILGDLKGKFSLGYKHLVPLHAGKKIFFGLIGDTTLEYQRGRFRMRARYGRDTPFSVWTDSIYYIQDSIGTGISYYLMTFVRLDYNFNLGKGRYPETINKPLPDGSNQEFNREDNYKTHSFGIIFRLFKNTGIGLNINHWERKSNVEDTRSSLFFGGYLTFDF
ncbi:hypothetical protein ACFLRX_02760 [Acidobacteriota bacterium]